MGQPPIPNPPIQPAVVEIQKKKSIIKPLLFILIFLLLAGGIYYLIFKMNILETLTGINLDNDIAKEEEKQVEDEGKEILTPFNGNFISTMLPDGWRVEEYKDGEGTDKLPGETEYLGLTGLKIFRGNIEIFYMSAISGIGFAGCPNYAKFKDEDPVFYTQIVEDNEISGMEVSVTDYTETDYEEFLWFNTLFRRVEKKYFYDVKPGNTYFEPACVPTLISFPQILEYQMDGQTYTTTFDYGPTDNATLEDLLVVDQILKNMKPFEAE